MPPRRVQQGLLALATSLASGLAGAFAPLSAQEAPQTAPASTSEIYTAQDFARFAPRNALDLIERIPGFAVADDDDGGGNGSRGFGQAGENLLINGERISSKSTSTADQLSRISIDNVVRIEVVDGATLGIPGLSGRVANIIVARGGAAGQFEWRPQFSTGVATPGWFEGEVSLTGSTGAVDYTLSVENGAFVRGSEGPAIFTDAAGVVDERNNFSTTEFNRPRINGTFAFDLAPEVVANLNVTAGLEFFRSQERERRIAGNLLPSFFERFRTDSDEWFYEIGGDIAFPLAGGQMKLIVLDSFVDGERDSTSLLDTAALPTSGTRFTRNLQSGERIGRGEFNWAMWGADWQISGEAAFNRLDQVGRLFQFDPVVADYVEVDFPSGAGGVREDRYEGLLSVGFPITANLTFQLVGGAEYSQIAQTGSNALSRTFERPKGSLNLAWDPVEGLDINLEIAKRIGQLDFGDFLASVRLSEDQADAGNNNLRPQQNWDVRLEVAKNFGRWGSVTLSLFDERIEDLVLILPVEGGGEARGNIESARRTGMGLTGTLQMEPLGLRGGRLDVQLAWEDSQLIDPVTGIERRFDGNDPFEIELDFRHDVPETDYAWGLSLRDTERAPSFRVRQVSLEHPPSTFAAAYIEHKDVLGATARIQVSNIFNANSTLQRTVYDGPRDTGAVLFTEDRSREIGQIFNLTISGSF